MAIIKRDLFSDIPDEKPENKPSVYSVSEVCQMIRKVLDDNKILSSISIEGEVSNLNYHSSGHIYFTLKDSHNEGYTINAFFSKNSYAHHARPKLQEGMKIHCKGKTTIYTGGSRYQLIVTEVWQVGEGELMQKFLMLKEKLKQEGLFNPTAKKMIPPYPKRVILLTSPTGAVLHDIKQTLENRKAKVEIIMIPCLMQGEQAVKSIIEGIQKAHQIPSVDYIIIARGGGSFEDLMPFNDESLARVVFAAQLPIVSAIGHETDTFILDFVADLRASTPTQAAQLLPDSSTLYDNLASDEQKINNRIQEILRYQQQTLDYLDEQLSNIIEKKYQQEKSNLEVLKLNLSNLLQKPVIEEKSKLQQFAIQLTQVLSQWVPNNKVALEQWEQQLQVQGKHIVQVEKERLNGIENQLSTYIKSKLSSENQTLQQLEKELSHLNPEKILERGYSLTLKQGKIVTSAHELSAGDTIETVFKDGRKSAEIIE